MKGARFADVAAIQERVTAILRLIAKEVFACMLHTHPRIAQAAVTLLPIPEISLNLGII
jgi:hypothetical protein